ncbi:MAG TPA: hypothetical protein VN704_06945 [Verrucomicrobiae bacterium]|nr:hypothetical protein [Verrucomicrobiae bacterium]
MVIAALEFMKSIKHGKNCSTFSGVFSFFVLLSLFITKRKRIQRHSFENEDSSRHATCRFKKYRIMSDILRTNRKNITK